MPAVIRRALVVAGLFFFCSLSAQQAKHSLYVGVPGEILVFDIDAGHRFVRKIPTWKTAVDGSVELVRGIALDASARRLYLSTVQRLAAIDVANEKIIWQQTYDRHCCDRFALSPDGATIFAPAFGKPHWNVVRARDGQLQATVDIAGWPRQTIYSRDGRYVYLQAWESRTLSVVDTSTLKVVREVGPFSGFVCPFTVNRRETMAFANVDALVGFEVGDLRTGLILDRIVVDPAPDAAAKYECPSHGIAFSPDERELWVADGVDNRLHVFDATTYPPTPSKTIDVRAQPRWMTFGSDGRYAYPSSGDVIDTSTKTIVAVLEDERGNPVQSTAIIDISN